MIKVSVWCTCKTYQNFLQKHGFVDFVQFTSGFFPKGFPKGLCPIKTWILSFPYPFESYSTESRLWTDTWINMSKMINHKILPWISVTQWDYWDSMQKRLFSTCLYFTKKGEGYKVIRYFYSVFMKSLVKIDRKC